jgi:hypothetical protein
MRDWNQLALPLTNTYVLRTDGGRVIATLNRMARGSIMWEWRVVLDPHSGSGILVARTVQDAEDLVETALVNAGICRFRTADA